MADSLLDNYNPLYDVHLRQYFALPHMQKHLRNLGLLQGGDDDEEDGDENQLYARHHMMMDMMLRNRESQLAKLADIQKKLDAAEKVEICRKIRSGVTSPAESFRRAKPSRSLSRSRFSATARQRRSSNGTEDKDLIKRIESENMERPTGDPNHVYNRLSATIGKYRYLHKLDDQTLSAYVEQLRRQLDKLERFREVSFGPNSIAKHQTNEPHVSWFFRRRSVESLKFRNRLGKSTSRHKLNDSHDSRATYPLTLVRRRNSDSNRLPPIARNGNSATSTGSSGGPKLQPKARTVPPKRRSSSRKRDEPVRMKKLKPPLTEQTPLSEALQSQQDLSSMMQQDKDAEDINAPNNEELDEDIIPEPTALVNDDEEKQEEMSCIETAIKRDEEQQLLKSNTTAIDKGVDDHRSEAEEAESQDSKRMIDSPVEQIQTGELLLSPTVQSDELSDHSATAVQNETVPTNPIKEAIWKADERSDGNAGSSEVNTERPTMAAEGGTESARIVNSDMASLAESAHDKNVLEQDRKPEEASGGEAQQQLPGFCSLPCLSGHPDKREDVQSTRTVSPSTSVTSKGTADGNTAKESSKSDDSVVFMSDSQVLQKEIPTSENQTESPELLAIQFDDTTAKENAACATNEKAEKDDVNANEPTVAQKADVILTDERIPTAVQENINPPEVAEISQMKEVEKNAAGEAGIMSTSEQVEASKNAAVAVNKERSVPLIKPENKHDQASSLSKDANSSQTPENESEDEAFVRSGIQQHVATVNPSEGDVEPSQPAELQNRVQGSNGDNEQQPIRSGRTSHRNGVIVEMDIETEMHHLRTDQPVHTTSIAAIPSEEIIQLEANSSKQMSENSDTATNLIPSSENRAEGPELEKPVGAVDEKNISHPDALHDEQRQQNLASGTNANTVNLSDDDVIDHDERCLLLQTPILGRCDSSHGNTDQNEENGAETTALLQQIPDSEQQQKFT